MRAFIILCLVASAITVSLGKPSVRSTLTFDRYWNSTEIGEYLTELSTDFSDFVQLETVGRTSEYNPIWALRVSKPGNENRPVMMISAGMKAREWTSIMATMYFLHEVIEHDYDFVELLENVDLLVMPLANPDGFDFSQTENREWIKTRSPHPATEECFGADMNRNFNLRWNTVGNSNNPCSDIFAGVAAASEPESRAIANQMAANIERLRLYVNVEGQGTMITYPYGSTETPSTNAEALRQLATEVSRSMESSVPYGVGPAFQMDTMASGSSIDYCSTALGVPMAFNFRLQNGGPNDYDLPEAELQSFSSGVFTGFMTFAESLFDSAKH